MITPSTTETFGFTVIESMSVGTPVLMPDVPVFRELHEDFQELFVSHEQDSKDIINQYTEKMLELISSKNKYSDRLIEHCKKYSWEQSALDVESMYRDAIENYKPSVEKKASSLVKFMWQVPVTKAMMKLTRALFWRYIKNEE